MIWIKSVFHSLYLLFLPVVVVLLSLRIAEEGYDIYWFAALLIAIFALAFFVVYQFRGWPHLPTIRLIMTACLGAGALIVFGDWYSDKEEVFLPLAAAMGTFAGWLFWDMVYNKVPSIQQPSALPVSWAQSGTWNVVLLVPHAHDPMFSQVLDEWEAHPVGAPVTLVGLEKVTSSVGRSILDGPGLNQLNFNNPSSRPLIARLVGQGLKGAHPAVFIVNPEGELVYTSMTRDRRKIPGPDFVSKIVSALMKNEPVLS